jgi:hypothetical protein
LFLQTERKEWSGGEKKESNGAGRRERVFITEIIVLDKCECEVGETRGGDKGVVVRFQSTSSDARQIAAWKSSRSFLFGSVPSSI